MVRCGVVDAVVCGGVVCWGLLVLSPSPFSFPLSFFVCLLLLSVVGVAVAVVVAVVVVIGVVVVVVVAMVVWCVGGSSSFSLLLSLLSPYLLLCLSLVFSVGGLVLVRLVRWLVAVWWVVL